MVKLIKYRIIYFSSHKHPSLRPFATQSLQAWRYINENIIIIIIDLDVSVGGWNAIWRWWE